MDEVCPNCDCDLAGDCCGTREGYTLDEIAYCCEPCAVDGECECGCIANPQPAGAGGQAQQQPPIPGPGI
ncbi:MAG TPA: hypothetical protein VGM69_22945 [Chloroflexota bacterium]|jgi:hypothetical protein